MNLSRICASIALVGVFTTFAVEVDSGEPDDPAWLDPDELRIINSLKEVPGDELAPAVLRAFEVLHSTKPEKFTFGPEDELLTTSGQVALVDWLSSQSPRVGAGTVADISNEILESAPQNLNARIVAVRNVHRHGSEEPGWTQAQLQQVLATPDVSRSSPFAFSQALDGVVETRDPLFVPILDQLLRSPDPFVSGAAALTVDRLAAVNPLGVVRALNESSALLSSHPGIRADVVGKLNLDDPAHKKEIERYLARQDLAADEKQKALDRFEQPASIVSVGIFTSQNR